MDEKDFLLAIMYDFYNEHLLKNQNDDIEYYENQILKYNAKNVLVVGAGTGRVTIPLNNICEVTALDYDRQRLRLLNEKDHSMKTICKDFLKYNTNQQYDMIIFPYSTIQFDSNKGNQINMFKKLYEMLSTTSVAIMDISKSFNTKPEKKEFLFEDYCVEIDDLVKVYYESMRYKEYIEFLITYKLKNRNLTLVENERYYYFDKKKLENNIENQELVIMKIDRGYGQNGFDHKHLYHVRRKRL